MTSPFGHPQVEPNGSGPYVRHLQPPAYMARVATTANIADLAAASTTIDGQTVAAGHIVLVMAQTDPIQNGLYYVGAVSGSAATLTRSVIMNEETDDVIPGTSVYVERGATNGAKRFQLTSVSPIVVGTTGLTFAQI